MRKLNWNESEEVESKININVAYPMLKKIEALRVEDAL